MEVNIRDNLHIYNIFAKENQNVGMKIFFILLFSLFASTLLLNAKSKEVQKGKASFYAKKFNNRKTASGAIYKGDQYVCAHKELPFGTKVIVRNPKNQKEVIVEVIDRGPHVRGRIIDLSYIAAKELDIVRHGIAEVEISKYIRNVPLQEKIHLEPLILDLSENNLKHISSIFVLENIVKRLY